MAANGRSLPLSEPIAIIGMACRFPGDATSPSKLWDLCATGREGWSAIPEDRFDVKALYDADHERIGRVGRSWGAYLSFKECANLSSRAM